MKTTPMKLKMIKLTLSYKWLSILNLMMIAPEVYSELYDSVIFTYLQEKSIILTIMQYYSAMLANNKVYSSTKLRLEHFVFRCR